MAQKKHVAFAQAKGAPAGFVLQGVLAAVSSVARMVYSAVSASTAQNHYLHSTTGLVRIAVTSNGVFVALSADADKAPAKAVQTLTSTGTAPANDSTVTIGDRVYTNKTTLTGAADEVAIGASAAAYLDNLKAAINGAAGEGTTYGTGTVAHEDVTATTNTDTTQVVEAKLPGVAGNSISVADDDGQLSWGDTELASGADGNFEEYIPAGGTKDIGIDEEVSVLSFIADGGAAEVMVVEY